MRKRSRVFFAGGSDRVAPFAWVTLPLLVGIGAVGPLAAFGSGCGAENGSYNAGTTADGGAGGQDSGTTFEDGAAGDASFFPSADGSIGPDGGGLVPPTDGAAFDGGPPASPIILLAIHASANLYPFRLCFGVGTNGASILPYPAYPDDPTQPMPETNLPGVPVGGAARLPPILFAGNVVTPYVVRADALGKELSTTAGGEDLCPALICQSGPSCLGNNFVQLPAVTLPTLGGTIALAVEGCVATALSGGDPGSVARCGATFDAALGNLSAVPRLLTPFPSSFRPDAGLAIELAELSPSWSGTSVTYVDPASDASVALVTPGLLGSTTPATLPLGSAGVMSAYFVMTAEAGAPVTQSLAAIQFFQAPAGNPTTYFAAPSAYYAAVVGDSTDAAAAASLPDGAPNPAFDGHGLHVIVYPEHGN